MTSELAAYEGVTVVDRDGKSIGQVLQVHADVFTGRPGWVTVRTGWLHGKSLVPIGDEEPVDGTLRVAYDSNTIKNAPWVDLDREAEQATEETDRTGDDESIQDDKSHDTRAQSDHWQIYEYYGLPFGRPDVTGAAAPDVTIDDTAAQTGQVGHTASVEEAPGGMRPAGEARSIGEASPAVEGSSAVERSPAAEPPAEGSGAHPADIAGRT